MKCLIRPIHDQVDAENAAAMIDLLASHTLNAGQSEYLDLLSDRYEKAVLPKVAAYSAWVRNRG